MAIVDIKKSEALMLMIKQSQCSYLEGRYKSATKAFSDIRTRIKNKQSF